ncbi:MAG: HAD family hydrolase [Rhodospirillaceae bacterium]|nr:MAG: HAD family hydrolase [Rhodospirillaceae bacterium]
MLPLSDFHQSDRQSIRGVFTDIDDTLTTDGRLTADAYQAMENLQAAGFLVVPITGRPAGWCDHIARMWPVDGVVGENGAFYFRYDQKNKRMDRRYVDDDGTRAENRARLEKLGQHILDQVSGSAISADQLYRETDLAIDFCEDVPALNQADIDHIVRLFEDDGATAKVSSIHVNGWYGTYDKLTMSQLFAQDCLGLDLNQAKSEFVFAGDSPNDAPMFAFFPHAVGVANVCDFENQLTAKPAYVTMGRGGAGFSELAKSLIDAREAVS